MMSGVSAKPLVIDFLHLMKGIILDLYLLMSYYDVQSSFKLSTTTPKDR